MGWFWADTAPTAAHTPSGHPTVKPGAREPPVSHPDDSVAIFLTISQPSCPMHKKSMDALTSDAPKKPEPGPTPSSCPVPHDSKPPPSGCPVPHDKKEEPKSILSQLNPLNYMFPDLSQKPAENQTVVLPTSREPSTIPKGTGDGNWEYPSPQQMYNALLRKGYSDTDVTAVESMVSVHNFLNEGAWGEILHWESIFGQGLWRGRQICRRGEDNIEEELDKQWNGNESDPSLVRFQGRPKDLTPKATMLQVLGWIYPSKYG